MKIRILLFCVIILSFCVWLLIHQASKNEASSIGQNVELVTNQLTQFLQHSNTVEEIFSNSNATKNVVSQAAPNTTHAATEEQRQQFIKNWQASIDFYGKVVDENTNPVEGASVHFEWDESPMTDVPKTFSTKSDMAGLFSLEGQHGRVLDVSVAKEGYYSSKKDKAGFIYALTDNSFSPSIFNPVIFHLHKKGLGESLIGETFPPGIGQIWQLHHDGTPIELDLLNGSQNVTGGGQLKLEFWRDISHINVQPFDWKLQLSITGGGFIGTDEEFAFQAPASGYQSPVVIDMPSTNQNWLGELRTKYYFQMPDGKYGRIDLYLLPRNGAFIIQSVINPSSSRNLEPQ
jgi:hypothetical protein